MTPTPQTQTAGVVQAAKRNWKTSVFGALMLAISGFTIYTDPSKATDPQVMTTIAGGLGLLLAKDGNKTGTAQ